MKKFDDKTMYNFEKYYNLQKSGKMNMVSPGVRTEIGITKDEHNFIIQHYDELLVAYQDLKVVDEVVADAKMRANGDYEEEKEAEMPEKTADVSFSEN